MTLIVCLDERGGMAFGGRRQSRDSLLLLDIFKTVGKERLLVAPYSEKLLSEYGRVKVKDNPLRAAKRSDFVLLEDRAVGNLKDGIDELIIYKWNRHYPADLYFDVEPCECGFALTETLEFAGSSHEKITKEIYRK